MPWRKLALRLIRWTFLAIGAATVAIVLFSHLYAVNESVYDPSLFAIGVGGLFAMGCGIMLLLLARIRTQRVALRASAQRCEALADRVWELKESEERTASLLEVQGDLIVRRDADGRITYANDAFCAACGRDREALLGTPFHPPVKSASPVEVLTDGTRIHDQELHTASGPRWFAWREVAVRSRNDGTTESRRTEVLSVGRDVTARTRAERALADARDQADAASRAKSRFLASMSHEIRTPLNGILGMAGLLADTPLTPEQRTYVHAVTRSGTALLALIEDVLDFSKIEAGRVELQTQPFAIAALIEETVELLAPRAHGKRLSLASDIAPDVPAMLSGDAARLRQVLLNLAGNAIKFTDMGGVAVLVTTASGGIAIDVRDTGIGIPPAQQERIFGEFEQVEGGADRPAEGTGLGLAISRRIVSLMGGRLSVESAPGAGSTFRMMLPLPAADEATFGEDETAQTLRGRAVLLIGMATLEASILSAKLSRWGAEVDTVTAEDAFRAMADQRWDTVLIDGADDSSAARALAGVASSAPHRIVLLTPAQRRGEGWDDGAFTGILIKPVRHASLAARMHEAGRDPAMPNASAAAARTTETISKPDAPRRLSVLVAEDNDINALLVQALLVRLGHHPTMVSNGEAAVAAWQTACASGSPYDVILMDVQMPGLNGMEATRRIRALENASDPASGAGRVPILAVTANAFREDRDAAHDAGMDDLLVKPIDRDRLAALLSGLSPRADAAA